MKNSTIFFITGYLLLLGFLGILLTAVFQENTILQTKNSLFAAIIMGLLGIVFMYFQKREECLGR